MITLVEVDIDVDLDLELPCEYSHHQDNSVLDQPASYLIVSSCPGTCGFSAKLMVCEDCLLSQRPIRCNDCEWVWPRTIFWTVLHKL